ncbi:MAG TPA: SatD family protein [Lachnospiraceae bacterium]|nr:SatD family protein [Lachnospiraceae bacterium]
MRDYVSLIIDIEKSRIYNMEERNEVQYYLTYYVKSLNKLFEQQLECEVTFSAGDELQGLFRDVTTALLYFRMLEMLIDPVNLRAGIGIGEWTVKISNGLSTQQDGPAYHRARKAIEEVYKMQLHNIRVCSEKDNTLVNHLINASMLLKRQQVYTQNMVLIIMELLYPFIRINTEFSEYQEIGELLKYKFKYRINKKAELVFAGKEKNFKYSHIQIGQIQMVDSIVIDGKIIEAEDAISKRNMATVLSNILGCTRQNVDSIMKRGNANKIRELDFIALQYLEKEYGGEKWN